MNYSEESANRLRYQSGKLSLDAIFHDVIVLWGENVRNKNQEASRSAQALQCLQSYNTIDDLPVIREKIIELVSKIASDKIIFDEGADSWHAALLKTKKDHFFVIEMLLKNYCM